jgi:hypothetical protein
MAVAFIPNSIVAVLKTSRDPGSLSFADWGKSRVLNELENILGSLEGGENSGAIDVQLNPAYAYGVLLLSGGSGAVGGTIGGKAVTATWATSDAASADLIAAAILADATALTYVSAVSRAATGTVTIASGSGAITAIINGVSISVTWASSDTATAAALAAAINALKGLPVVASSSAGVVTLWSTLGTNTGSANTDGNAITLAATGTGATASGAILSGGGTNANVLIKALVPGTIGNGITLVASGTGVTAPTGARLVGGIGAPGNSLTV